MRSVILFVGFANCRLKNETGLDYEDYDGERSASRYLMDYPICTSVEECANVNGKSLIINEAELTEALQDALANYTQRKKDPFKSRTTPNASTADGKLELQPDSRYR